VSGNRRPLFHVLYTNAAVAGQRGGTGFRTLAVHFPGTQGEKERIGDWLQSLRPAPEAMLAWGFRSFRVAGGFTAALAVVDPHFGRDEHGRAGGLLAHAFLVPVPEGEPAGDFGTALGEVAERFFPWNERQEAHDLARHLAGCEAQGDLEVPPFDPAAVRALPVALRLRLWRAASLGESGAVAFAGTDEERLPAALLRAASALPPRLRLQLQWAAGVAAAPGEGFLARPAGRDDREPSKGERWSEWLELQLAGEPGRLARLAESWQVMAWDRLAAAGQEESADVKAKGKPSRPRMSKVEIGVPDPVDLDDQYQALQGWLRDYVDLRTGDSPIEADAPPAPAGSGPAWLAPLAPWLALAATILAALLLLATVWLFREVRDLKAELAKRPVQEEPASR
jgi:hypothetical protein